MRLLLVEDNADLAANVREHFEALGHFVDPAGDAEAGLALARARRYDAIVLDVGLPGMDGVALCRALRQDGHAATPVLMLTARDTLADKLQGFAAGADDYLVKPFALQELEARLHAIARRAPAAGAELRVGDLTVNVETMRVQRGTTELHLPPAGLKLLLLLMRVAPRVASRRELERALWGESPPESDALRAHMHALRLAVDHPFGAKLLRTVRGLGYRLQAPDAS